MQAKVSVLSPEEMRMLEERVDLITDQYEGGVSGGMLITWLILAIGVISLIVTLQQLDNH